MESGYFDTAARDWDSPDKVARAEAIAQAVRATVPLQPDWHALEFGAGTGLLARALGEALTHLTITDVSDGMLEVARERTASDPDRYDVRAYDLVAEPFDPPVDLVVSALALHHIADTDRLLDHVRASLRPGGWVALADLDADPHNHFHPDDFHGHRGIDRNALVSHLADRGFDEVGEQTATTLTKAKDGVERTFDVFLVTGRLSR